MQRGGSGSVDLTGKIALVDFDWDYVLWMNNVEHQVADHGAIGMIFYTTNGYGTDASGQAEFVELVGPIGAAGLVDEAG